MNLTELDLISIGQRIRYHRIHKRLTQIQLTELIEGKGPIISQYERGRTSPSLLTLSRLAKTFHTSVDYLLTGRNAEPSFQETFNPDRFPCRLKNLRKLRGHQLKDAATGIGCLPTSLHLYEKGETTPPLKIIYKITQFYDCTADFLASGSSINDPLEDLFQPAEEKRNEMILNFVPEEHEPVEQIEVMKVILSLRIEQLDYKMKLAIMDREAMLSAGRMEELYIEHAELSLMNELAEKLFTRYKAEAQMTSSNADPIASNDKGNL